MYRLPLSARCAAAVILFLALGACSRQNDQAPALSGSGSHTKTWIIDHRAAFQANPDQCTACHGADLKGGIAKVDCFNQGNLPACHAGGHPPRKAGHPVPFTDPTQHGPLAKQNLVFCQTCHAQPGGAGTNPRFNLAIGGLPVGCEGAGCHNLVNPAFPARSSAHPMPWRGHNSSGNQLNACSLCHGNFAFGGAATGGVGPACNSCHTRLPLGALPSAGSCNSCHLFPPTSGSHAAHLGLASITCNACHAGGGTGTLPHYNGTLVLGIFTSFNAKSGSARVLPGNTCSNVRCHGGITTPVWGVGQIDVSTDCTSCHRDDTATRSNPTQFNSFRSGEHRLHVVTIGLSCTVCHDMTVTAGAASHFSNFATPVFELPAAATIRSAVNYNPAGPSCQPVSNALPGATVGCHGLRFWN